MARRAPRRAPRSVQAEFVEWLFGEIADLAADQDLTDATVIADIRTRPEVVTARRLLGAIERGEDVAAWVDAHRTEIEASFGFDDMFETLP